MMIDVSTLLIRNVLKNNVLILQQVKHIKIVIIINKNVQLLISEVVQIYNQIVLIIKRKFNVILIIHLKNVLGHNIMDVENKNVQILFMNQKKVKNNV